MKIKIISIILSVFLLSTIGAQAAKPELIHSEKSQFNTLKALGFMDEESSGNITRGEFSIYVSKLFLMEIAHQYEACPFSDIKSDHPDRKSVV